VFLVAQLQGVIPRAPRRVHWSVSVKLFLRSAIGNRGLRGDRSTGRNSETKVAKRGVQRGNGHLVQRRKARR
jgi:hypothetical protein